MLTKFNGVQVEQSSQYIRIHCSDYLDRLIDRHGWSTPNFSTGTSNVREPTSQHIAKQIDTESGPPEHSPEGILTAKTAGFAYCHLLGALIYAYVVYRISC